MAFPPPTAQTPDHIRIFTMTFSKWVEYADVAAGSKYTYEFVLEDDAGEIILYEGSKGGLFDELSGAYQSAMDSMLDAIIAQAEGDIIP